MRNICVNYCPLFPVPYSLFPTSNVVCLGLIWQILLFNAIGARVVKGFFPYKESQ
ncbi:MULTISPECIES: hypothetical protein [unclassified Moorena]|uniref:hypothetical protein n=1 Tax=unclassified Moorena TaxID=2683338 RepID=UPI0013C6D7C5|nr:MULTISPECIES: hypothetical protein [unclassified Moorena]NEO23569.1 hypothetical protein [Moorena sp. SIO4A5]NEQ59699.1 hypothetical protein [Moorena sp. SIO4A1]